jgi:hypothetical protein
LEDFIGAGTAAAIGDELIGFEIGVLGAIDDVEEAEFDGVGNRYPVIQVPETVEG